MHTFPELELKGRVSIPRPVSILIVSPEKPNGFWKDKQNTKNFLVHFAATKGFDPHIAENWESVTRPDIRSTKVFPVSEG